MHEVEHKPGRDDSAVEAPPTDSKETHVFKPLQNGTTRKLPRAWKYGIAGGTALLVLAVIFAGILSSGKRAGNQPSPSHSSSTPVSISTSLPTPTATPIQSTISSGHNVSMTIADGVAYLGTNDGAMYALRADNGALLWHQRIDGSIDVRPFVVNGVVYFTSFVGQVGPGYVYALRAGDGSLLWRYSSSSYSFLTLPTADSSVAYVTSQDGITALNASSGIILWHHTTTGSASSWALVNNGVVYVSSFADGGPGTFYALHASNGALLWQYPGKGFSTRPLVSDGLVYVVSDDGILAALRASDGHSRWKRALDANLFQSLQLVDGVIYTSATKISELPTALNAGSVQGAADVSALLWNALQTVPARPSIPLKQGTSSVYAIRASDGAVLWRFPMHDGRNVWGGWFSVANGVVYASANVATNGSTNEGDIYALQSSNGAVLWHDTMQASPSDALLANGIIYLSSADSPVSGAIYALRARDGSMLWNYPLAGSVYNAPGLVGNTIYVGAANGLAYALRAGSGTVLWHYQTDVGA